VDTTATPKVCKACDAGKVLAAGEVIASSTKTCATATTCKENFYVDTTATPKVCKACAAGTVLAAGEVIATSTKTCAAPATTVTHKVQGAVTFPLKINENVNLLTSSDAATIRTALKEGIAAGLGTTADKVTLTAITATKSRRLEAGPEGRRLNAVNHSIKVDYEVKFDTANAASVAATAMKVAPASNTVVANLVTKIKLVENITALGFAKSDNTNMAVASFTSSGDVYTPPPAASSAGALASISATSVLALTLALGF
jgi:hypothetical protein